MQPLFFGGGRVLAVGAPRLAGGDGAGAGAGADFLAAGFFFEAAAATAGFLRVVGGTFRPALLAAGFLLLLEGVAVFLAGDDFDLDDFFVGRF